MVFRNRRSIAPWLPWVCLGPVILGSHCILYKVRKNIPLFSATGFTTTFLGTWSFLFLSRSVVVNKVASSFPLASTGHSDLVLAPLVLCLFLQLPPICSPRDLRFPMHPLLMQGGFSVAFFFSVYFWFGLIFKTRGGGNSLHFTLIGRHSLIVNRKFVCHHPGIISSKLLS